MKILAIESSCDETAAAVITDGKIKSNVLASQVKTHLKYGGVVPEVAAREHVEAIIPVIDLALRKAKTKFSDIDYLAVTQGPGLITSLMVGVNTAQALSIALNKPLIPTNHMEGHVYANFASTVITSEAKQSKKKIAASLLAPRKDNKSFPALVLIVSGGHTMLVLMRGHGKYKIIGETVDDAAGEAFDKTAKILGLPYPGGPHLSKLAKTGDPQAFNFPRPMINSNDLNFSFSGLKTAVLYEVQKYKSLNSKQKADFAASIEQAIVDVLIAKTEKAIQQHKPKTIMLGGGVAANDLLRQKFKLLAKSYPDVSVGTPTRQSRRRGKLQTSVPLLEYCTDNAAMIGLAAYYKIKNRTLKKINNFTADPNLAL